MRNTESAMTMNSQHEAIESELLLVDAAQAGDIGAFNQLVTRYQGQVYGLCLRMLGDRDTAEDAAQETFMRAYYRLSTFQGGRFRLWLLRIAANMCRDMLRQRRRRGQVSLSGGSETAERSRVIEPASTEASPDERMLRHELSAAIVACLDQLPEPQRTLLILSDIQGLSYEEIAEVLRIPVGTVKSRLSRSRARLRDILCIADLVPQHYRSPVIYAGVLQGMAV